MNFKTNFSYFKKAELEDRTPGYVEVQVEAARNENITDKISKKFVLTQNENQKFVNQINMTEKSRLGKKLKKKIKIKK